MMKTTLSVLITFLLFTFSVNAQNFNATSYPLSTTSGNSLATFSSLGTLIASGQDDTNSTPLTNIGFDFWYNGTRYTQFGVNANGQMELGALMTATGATNYTNDLANGADYPKIAPFWDDQTTGTDGYVRYGVNGSAPNRVLIVEWKTNVYTGTTSVTSAATLTYQVQLYETSGIIKFVYGSGVTTANGVSIGLATSTTNIASIAIASDTATYGSDPNTAQNGTLTSGKAYVFTPETTANPSALTFSNVAGTSMTVGWTDNASNESGYVVYTSTDNTTYTFNQQVAANTTTANLTGLTGGTLYYVRVYAVSGGKLSSPVAGSQYTLATVTFNTAGNASWAAPSCVTSITVETWGSGGGGGNSSNTTTNGGSGGGGGAYARGTHTVTPGSTYFYTVGAGGSGSAAGGNAQAGNGSSTWFRATAATNTAPTTAAQGTLAAGGGRGLNNNTNSTTTAGTAGTAAASLGNVSTASGTAGTVANANGGGNGGAGAAPNGGAGGTASATAGTNGGDGGIPGGGGGGADDSGGSAGGNGGVGQIIITYLPQSAAATPVITGTTFCSTITSLSGTSTEANGTTIELYNGSVSLGTTTVNAGAWTKSGLSFTGGETVYAIAYSSCKSASASSNTVSILAAPTVSVAASSNTICTGDAVSLTGTVSFNHDNPIILINENFNAATNNWTRTNTSTGGTTANAAWTLRASGYANAQVTFNSNDNTQFYLTDSRTQNGTTTATTLVSPVFSTQGLSSCTLEFYYYYRDNNANDNAIVEVSTNGSTWQNVQTYSANQGTSTGFVLASLSLNSVLNQSTVYVRFRYATTSRSNYWAVDNVVVKGQPTETYSWTSSPSGFTASTQNVASVSPTVTTTYTLSVTNYAGCTQTASTTVTVNPNLPASVSIAASATTICAGTSVTFTATPTNGGTTPSYQWKVNGNNVGTNSATYTSTTLNNNDAVTVVMTSNASPCLTGSPATSNTITMTVNPNLPASVSIAASATTICAGTSVTFTATPTNGGTTPSYQWKVNGNNVGTNSATYTSTTLNNNDAVTVVMTSNASPCLTGSPATSNTITMTVNPNLPASVSIAASATTICAGTSVTFTATPTNGGTTPSYQWKVNGSNVGTNSTTYTSTTLNNNDAVTVVMTSNASPCLTGSPATSNTITMTVNPNLPASVSITASATTICAGTSVTFTATPTNGGTTPSYQWKVNGSNVGTNSATYTSTTLNNNDAVTVVMTSNASPCLTGSPATSNTITMTVNPNLPASVSIAASATTICTGTSVTFTATPTNGGTTPSYQWRVNGNNVGTNSATYTTTTLANGNTVTCVMTSNASPCLTGSPATSNTITMTVNPNLPASVSIAASATTICEGTSVTFTATPTNGGTTPSYQWKVNGNNVGTDNALFTTTALQQGDVVTVVMTSNASTCLTGSPATSNSVTMTVNPLASASITSNNGPAQCYGSDISFTVSGTTNAILYYNLNGGGTQFTILTGGSATITVTGATASQTLNLVSVDNGQCPVTLSETATVAVNTTTWDGTSWSDGTPDATKAAFVTGNLTIASNLQACALVISNNAVVSVASGSNVTLQNAISVAAGSSFTVNSNANLIQVNPNAVNSGNIVVKRTSNPLIRLDYILWGSPVAGQNLFNFSPLTSVNPNIRFYQYNPATNIYNSIADYATHTMQAGKGYLIRLPFNHPTAAAVWNGSFTGVPNNGTYNVTLGNNGSGFRYNAVSNPYPSTLDIAQFYSENASNVEPTLYFWRKTNNATKPSYCTWNMDTDTFVDNGEAYTESPNGIIQVGQGFFVEAKGSATSVVFNNTQRVGNNANQMFKSQGVTTQNAEKHRIWLNITSGNDFAQAVVGYFSNGTLAADATDSKLFNDGNLALTAPINGEHYIVNGRPVPFDAADVVPLSYKATTAGTMTITIDHVDGLFASGTQDIYLHDLTNNTYNSLNQGPYVFQSQAGTFTNRFELVYQNALSNHAPSLSNLDFQVIRTQNVIRVQAQEMIDQVLVFDLQGRLITQLKTLNQQQAILSGVSQDQAYLVRVVTTSGKTGVKKVM